MAASEDIGVNTRIQEWSSCTQSCTQSLWRQCGLTDIFCYVSFIISWRNPKRQRLSALTSFPVSAHWPLDINSISIDWAEASAGVNPCISLATDDGGLLPSAEDLNHPHVHPWMCLWHLFLVLIFPYIMPKNIPLYVLLALGSHRNVYCNAKLKLIQAFL